MRTIHCIGDSHSAVFSGEEAMQPCWPEPAANKIPYFKSYRIGPATAYQLHNKQPLIEEVINSIDLGPKDALMFCFGEVDIRAHLLKQVEIQDRDIQELTLECAQRYIDALKYYKKYDRRIIVWGPIASWCDSKPYTGGPSFGTNVARNLATHFFNRDLIELCAKERMRFISIFDDMINEDFTTKPEFLDDWEGSHMHLSQRSMPTILKRFKDRGFIE